MLKQHFVERKYRETTKLHIHLPIISSALFIITNGCHGIKVKSSKTILSAGSKPFSNG